MKTKTLGPKSGVLLAGWVKRSTRTNARQAAKTCGLSFSNWLDQMLSVAMICATCDFSLRESQRRSAFTEIEKKALRNLKKRGLGRLNRLKKFCADT